MNLVCGWEAAVTGPLEAGRYVFWHLSQFRRSRFREVTNFICNLPLLFLL
jgi:hypothetical protein